MFVFGLGVWVSSGPGWSTGSSSRGDEEQRFSLKVSLSVCGVFGLGGWVSSGPGWSTGSSSRGDEEQRFSLKVSLSVCGVFGLGGWVLSRPGWSTRSSSRGDEEQRFSLKVCSLHVKAFLLADSTVAFGTVVDALEDIHFFLSDLM